MSACLLAHGDAGTACSERVVAADAAVAVAPWTRYEVTKRRSCCSSSCQRKLLYIRDAVEVVSDCSLINNDELVDKHWIVLARTSVHRRGGLRTASWCW